MVVEREELKRTVGEVCQRVWRGEGFPDSDLERGDYSADYKEEGGEKGKGIEGVTLMPSAYKIYTVLVERLEKEIEEKGLIPERQAGFRKGRGVIDNTYVMNYLVKRELARGRKVVATFVDLKTAFDSVDRGILKRRGEGSERGFEKEMDQGDI